MSRPQWEWKFGPAFITSALQLLALVIGIGIVWGKAQTEQAVADKAIAELRAIVTTLSMAQASASERVAKVETKVDLMLPALQRIEARQMSEGRGSRDVGHP